jgi:2'-5' RNA ligase
LPDIVNYLSAHAGFSIPPFRVSRFVLMSSRQSTGGGPYVVEGSWELHDPAALAVQESWPISDSDASRIIR